MAALPQRPGHERMFFGQQSRVTRTVLGRASLVGLLGLAVFTLMLAQGLLHVLNAANPVMPLDGC